MLWLFWFARSWNSSARCATRITSSTCGYLVRPQCHTLTEELTESKTIEDELLESTFRCHTMWRRPAWLVWKLKTWKDMKTSLDAPSKQEFANSKVSWRNCSFTFHHIWDVLWRKFRYRYILYILKNFLDMICRYAYVFWYVKLSFLTYRFPDRPARSNSASWRVCWRGGGFGSGTTCLGFSLRHQSRRGKNKEPLCQQSINQSVKHFSTCWGRHGGCAFAP